MAPRMNWPQFRAPPRPMADEWVEFANRVAPPAPPEPVDPIDWAVADEAEEELIREMMAPEFDDMQDILEEEGFPEPEPEPEPEPARDAMMLAREENRRIQRLIDELRQNQMLERMEEMRQREMLDRERFNNGD